MHTDEKKLLALEAFRYVKEGMSLFFDASSTVSQLIMLLSDFQNLTCITNGLNNGQILSYKTSARTYIIPGEIVKKTNSTSGIAAFAYLDNFNCDIFFFSCRGLSLEKGTTEASVEQATIKRKMSECAKKRILLVDQSKIDEVYIGNSISINEINVVITNKELPKKYMEYFNKNNIEVRIVRKN
jgi:DeoR family fructose operon transcriptional repressor